MIKFALTLYGRIMATIELPLFLQCRLGLVTIPHLTFASVSVAPISDYTFWINVSLSAASLAVTCVAVVVAISAFIGYQAMRRMIRRQTQKHARIATADYLQGDAFKALVRRLVDDATRDHIKSRITIALSRAEENSSETPHKTELKGE